MKILLLRWGTFNEEMLFQNLKARGHEVSEFVGKPADYNVDPQFIMQLLEKLEETGAEAVFSYDYFPIIADVCNMRGCLYISWVFDCPHSTLFSKSVFHKTNRIFVFDKMQCEELKSYGVEYIYHLPLAVDAALFSYINKEASEENRRKYSSEVSFMGGMYTGEYNFFDQIKYLPDYVRGYLDGIIASQQKIYGYNFVREMLNDEMVEKIQEYVKFDFGDQYFVPYKNIIANMLNKKVTVQERQEAIKLLSEYFPVDLYTGSSTADLPKVNNRGFVSYTEVMPLVFHESRINLNITLKSITSGIPLRALDIMACGGFLLSNYQPELAEYFVDGEELVLYTDMEDLFAKTEYYLSHEEERRQIARAGFEKVKKEFSYVNQLAKIEEKIAETL